VNEDLKRNLLASAADDGLDEDARARVAAALGVGAAGVSAGSALAAGGAKSAMWIKWLLGSAIAAAIIGGLLMIPRGKTEATAIEKRALTPPAIAAPVAATPAQSAVPDVPTVSITDLPSAIATAKKQTPEAPAEDDLAELERIRAEIGSDASRALADVDRYDARHASSAYAEEIAVLRIEALAALGGGPALQQRATAFLAKFPSSPYAKRVRSIVAGDGGSR
jgi:hypothetical protein